MLRPYKHPRVPRPSFFRRLKIRVGARGVVGDVHDPAHGRHELGEHSLDALAQRDIGHAATLTAAAHAEHHHTFLDVDQLYPAAMAGYHGIHLLVEDLRDLLVQLVIIDR